MHDVTDLSVVGAGAMGHGLTVHCALAGLDVTLVDHRQANLDAARDRIREASAFLASEGLADADPDEVLDGVDCTLDLAAGVADADVVVETISEDLDAKRDLFSRLAEATSDAVLASNTSGLSIDAIAEAVPDDAARVAGCHWWYPPYLLRPVEIVRGTGTSDETVARLRSFVERVDRDPVLVERDVPGFVWNRVQFAVVRECLHIVEEGVASVEDVNRAVRDGYATRTAAIGPFETMDIAGLDLFGTIAEGLFPALSNADAPQNTMCERVESGRTGIDAGAGFFDYDEPPETVTRRRDERVAAIQRALDEETERD
ncbi:3-hydroxyacyl-CoA dehydrogenase [Salinigranum rubrum]|uniref:3-hydroxyacyl-CoA dehydrogenase n=1 Tax=Salinigranum rubrum TaxID=755307 RepID=A0A2I8VMS9_9EURY|nr:3-hydroxyacyl-CoA dehydrogenase NAD-binding domain-containing protein [Salinigranum rubrum]AUV82399.1 3-hydroxyacyl-CoA dehydrogenase [Salinigranum rubrum]